MMPGRREWYRRAVARIVGMLGAVVALSGCASSAPGASMTQLQQRAQIDLSCPGAFLQHYRLDDRSQLVVGCQRQLVYVESCERIRGAWRCTWRLDSPWLYAPQVTVSSAAEASSPSRPPSPSRPAVRSEAGEDRGADEPPRKTKDWGF